MSRIIQVSLQVAAQSLLDCLYGMHVKVFAPVCSVAAGSSSLILPSSCHRLTRNRTLRIRVTLTVTSITCMSSREVENKLSSQSDASHSKLIALILNYNLPTQVHKLLHKGKVATAASMFQHPSVADSHWRDNAAQFCICADGGANQLYDAAPRFAQHLSAVEARQLVRPAVIVGDLDSIKDEVRQFYAQLGTEIKDLSSDQNTTDLQKCLTELEHRFSTQELADMTIVVAGECHFLMCSAMVVKAIGILLAYRCQTLTLPAVCATLRGSRWQVGSHHECPQHSAQVATSAFSVVGRWQHGSASSAWQACDSTCKGV